MQKSLKNILMSGAAAGAVVGGTLLVVNSQLTTPQTEGSTLESTSKPTPKVKEGSVTPSVSSSSSESSSTKETEVKSTTSEKKEDKKVGQPKEDATSTSTVPSIQEKQEQEAVKEEPKQEMVETVSDKVEEKPRTLNPTTTVRRVSDPIEKADISKLNQTRKVIVSVPRKETPTKPTAVSTEAPKFELPEFKGGVVPNDAPILEKPEYKILTVSEEPKQPVVPVVEIPQPQPQAPQQQQFVAKELPNTGTSDSDKLVALSGVGLLGLLGFSFKKRKED